jgi:cell division protein FtsI/penicillin-binding protein 2
MKAELGSTAKLRTLAHYLELVASLYDEFGGLDSAELARWALSNSADPITRWVAGTLISNPGIKLSALLDEALNRKYSGSPDEVFFTGGGAHHFSNFDRNEDHVIYTVREGLKQSVNLVYIRLMRDLVRFHESRLEYDPEAILNQPEHPERIRLLKEIAADESEYFLRRAYEQYKSLPLDAAIERILKNREGSSRQLSMLFLAWNGNSDVSALRQWLRDRDHAVTEPEARRLFHSYDPARLNLADYGYVLGNHPLEIWCAGQLVRNPTISWNDLLANSGEARELSSRWLFRTRNKRAQDRRLRVRIEQDAFARMTPYWQRLGFPFERLVPSLATAIGSSADRPIALAQLMGIILNDGIRLPVLRFEELRFAAGTPYQTEFQPNDSSGTRVMQAPVAIVLRKVLAEVVEDGTAKRLAGVFDDPNGNPLLTGGKTGSGDNRPKPARRRTLQKSAPVSRTGTFAFYIGDRYFGVLTAYVGGTEAEDYTFTSALPVSALKLLAPAIASAMHEPAWPASTLAVHDDAIGLTSASLQDD